MTRLEITLEMADWITSQVQSLREEDPAIAAIGALPLYRDPRSVLAIRPDGTLLEWSADGRGTDVRPIVDRSSALLALLAGARRHPKFRPLLPAPGPGDIACDCHRIPPQVSGMIGCSKCGHLGWLDEEGPRFFRPTARQGPKMPAFGLVFIALGIFSFMGAIGFFAEFWRGPIWNALLLLVVGVLSLYLAPRGIGRRPTGDRPAAQGPTFDLDDPEIADLPSTSTTHLGEQVRRARERRKRAGDW